MFTFLLWCILFVMCWPMALLALVAYPFVWLLLLPFRIIGVAVHGVLEIIFLVRFVRHLSKLARAKGRDKPKLAIACEPVHNRTIPRRRAHAGFAESDSVGHGVLGHVFCLDVQC